MMRFLSAGSLASAILALAATAAAAEPVVRDDAKADPVTRKFRFVYAGVINELAPRQSVRVWLPVAPSTFGQKVQVEKIATPAPHRKTREAKYGNALIYFEARASEAGEVPFSVEYLVERQELTRARPEPLAGGDAERFAEPVDEAPPEGSFLQVLFPQERPAPREDVVAFARLIYDAVEGRMKYEKPPGGAWGRGDAVWACRSGYGNCTDFHSLFMAACREARTPSKFEIGFSLPPERGAGEIPGYHCWAKFASGGHWLPVDISEADKHPEMKDYYFGNLTADRVLFTVGRTLQLEPEQVAEPVNFLVYPYVEANGRPHTPFQAAFEYEDL
jgi:transglutaminase-like putative cysteine protease